MSSPRSAAQKAGRYIRPAEVDMDPSQVYTSRHLAEGLSWALDLHDIWRLDIEHLQKAIECLDDHARHRRMTNVEAAIMARLAHHLRNENELALGAELDQRALTLTQVATYVTNAQNSSAERAAARGAQGGQGGWN